MVLAPSIELVGMRVYQSMTSKNYTQQDTNNDVMLC